MVYDGTEIRALLRRSALKPPEMIERLGDLVVDLTRHLVRREERKIDLTAREYTILLYLLANREKPVTRIDLGRHLIGPRFRLVSNMLDVSVSGLRSKLGSPPLIHAVRGVGYVVAEPGSASSRRS